MILAERDEHLASLGRLLAECRAGNGRFVLVEGAVAHGKTELLRTFAERAVGAGALFLNATCSQVESALPMGVLSQLFHHVEIPPGFRERVADLLDRGASISISSDCAEGTVEPAMAHVFHGLLLMLLELAGGKPVLIGVDDVQHADTTSLHGLLYLVRRVHSARVLVVFTETAQLSSARSPLHAELRQLPHYHRMSLAPLSQAGVAGLIARHQDSRQARVLAESFYAASGGNPMLVHALLEDHSTSGTGPGRCYQQALVSCLYRCDPTVLDVARGLAVLGADASSVELGELVSAGPEVAATAVNSLATTGLLEDGVFRHPAGERAVLDEVPPQDRADLHRRAARLLHDRGAPAITVARHLVSAGHIADAWVADVLVEAADQALFADEVALAVDCLMLAGRALPDGRSKVAVRARLARAEWQINPSTAQRHFTPLTAGMRANQLDPREAITMTRQMLWHGQITEAVEVLNWLRGLGPGTHDEVATEIRDVELWIACVYPALERRHHIPRKPVDEKNTLVRLTTDPWLRSTAALAEGLTRGDRYDAVVRAEYFLQEVHLSHATPWAEEPAVLALLTLIYTGRTSAAAGWCERLVNEAATRQAPTWQATFSAVRSEIALRQGDLRTAVNHAQAAMTHMSSKAWGVAVGFPLGCLILAAARKGDYEEAAKHVAQPVPEAMFQSRYGLHYLHARGHHYLAVNHHHAALADFLACGELMRGWGLDMPGFVSWRTSAAEAWLCLGNHDQAKRLLFDQLAKPGTEGSRTRGMSLRLLAAGSQASRRPQLLTESVEIFESCGDRFELARALAELGHAYHALGEHRRARMMLRRAWHVAKTCDATPLCRAVLREPMTVDLTIPQSESSAGIDSLTGAQRRVAALAVAGYTNREIANKLFITASTVEQHLTRVYRKLNVKYRRDLPTDLHADMATSA
ncbi:MAG: AAA family ATPase [Pseudonocardiales bacterium]|nr:AAA family ATPase [Pseudonocardiales bacterium]MBV9031429.1 AAA family ATPase [Pseudonocardiales bacterium]